MAITPAQLEQRKTFIGSSDISAILGLNPWRDQLDVLSSKRPDLVDPRPEGDMRKADFGTRMEPVLRGWLEDELDMPVVDCAATLRHQKYDFIGAHPDADIPKDQAFGELKVSGLDEGWGEPGTDSVPAMVVAQCLWQLACAPNRLRVHVVRCAAGRDWTPSRYVVNRDNETIDNMVEAGAKWWRDHVIGGMLPRPSDTMPLYLESAKRIVRKAGAEVEVDYFSLIKPWVQIRDARLQIEKDEKSLLAKLLATMGAARVARCPEGVFHFADESAGLRVETEKLKTEFPEVYREVAKESRRDMPRWKAVKGPKG